MEEYSGNFFELEMTYLAALIACLSSTAVTVRSANWCRRRATCASFLKIHVTRRELERRKFRKVLRSACNYLRRWQCCSLNVLSWISAVPSRTYIAPPYKLHVPRRELERKFEIVLLAENARMERKSSANEKLKLTSICSTEFR